MDIDFTAICIQYTFKIYLKADHVHQGILCIRAQKGARCLLAPPPALGETGTAIVASAKAFTLYIYSINGNRLKKADFCVLPDKRENK